jgi:hypothetical protein
VKNSPLRRGLAVLVFGAAVVGGGLAMSGTAGATTLGDPAPVLPMTLAPSCVSFTQYQHGNAITGYYTTVYLDNNCGYQTRVKIIMRNGYDSGCLQMNPGLLDKKFTSDSDNGLKPYVDRLDAC